MGGQGFSPFSLPKPALILQNNRSIYFIRKISTKENTMKFFYVIISLIISLNCANALAADEPKAKAKPLTQKEEKLLEECNLAARNSLVNEDLAHVEKVCTQAINEIDRTHPGQEELINPIMNMAFSFTLAGQFDKAAPLYKRARDIREKLYGPNSKKLKEIDNYIKAQEGMKRDHSNGS